MSGNNWSELTEFRTFSHCKFSDITGKFVSNYVVTYVLM